MKRFFSRLKNKLKAKLRDWCFSEYKWITRAQVQRILCCKMWQFRDNPSALKAIIEIQEEIK